MSFSDLMEYRILDAFVDNLPWVEVGDPHWMGLCTDQPEEDGSDNYEVSGGDYARVQSTSSDWSMASIDGNGVTYINNTAEITFPEATADWGIVTHFAIFSAAVAGLFLLWGVLEEPYDIVTGSIPRFDIGVVKITME